MLNHSAILHPLGTSTPAGSSKTWTTGYKISQERNTRNVPFIPCLQMNTLCRGTLPESEMGKAPVHTSSHCEMIVLLKWFLRYFQTSTRLFLKLIKCRNHLRTYRFRYFFFLSFQSRTPPAFHFTLTSFSLILPKKQSLFSLKLSQNLSCLNLIITIFICLLAGGFNTLSPC